MQAGQSRIGQAEQKHVPICFVTNRLILIWRGGKGRGQLKAKGGAEKGEISG